MGENAARLYGIDIAERTKKLSPAVPKEEASPAFA
jgi:hypothetical protein